MAISTTDLITHPIRARILVSLMGRELTTQEIATLLPDVPRATLYRQLRHLVEGKIIDTVREVPVRGTLEKVYAVRRDAGHIPASEISSASRAEHLRHFTTFVDTMMQSYRAYLEEDKINPPHDITMVATPLFLDEGQYQRFRDELRQFLHSFQQEEPSSNHRRVLWIVSIPDRKEASSFAAAVTEANGLAAKTKKQKKFRG